MAEWLYEEGIGENRAILVEGGRILEAMIEESGELSPGTVAAGRLTEILVPGRRGVVATHGGVVLVEPLPPQLTKGQITRVQIQRAPIPEPGNWKYAKGRITDEPVRAGATLLERIGACTRLRATDPDRFEEAGWTELLHDAIDGEIDFDGGHLRMSVTPAMTLFDVDGGLPPAQLAIAGAAAAGKAIRRFGIGGSIGIDLPTLASKQERQQAAAALDAVLPQPFERTSVNGFGFLQVVRRRERQSLPELLQYDSVSAAARMLLRRAERVRGVGVTLIDAATQVIGHIENAPGWVAELELRTGRRVRLQQGPRLSIWGGNVQTVQS